MFIDCVYVNNEFICILDLPVILSQNYCGFLEPQERVWKGESGKGFYLEKLQSKYQEALEPFDGICGFSKHNPSYQDKTLFRFPLRTRESNLSSDVYTIDKLHSLLHTLKEEAQYLLVFLRSVCSIEICKITESNDTLSLFKVSVSQRDYLSRLSQQKQLISRVESIFTGQSQYSIRDIIKDASRFNIEKVDGGTVSNYDWLVVNQIGSNDNDVMQLAEKQHILPWVGTAINLNDPISNGRIFCVLPLPVEDQAPFHVHVNGTFAISSNRRSLKWEAQERKGDEEGTWNKLLVEKCLPSCYFKLVSELMELLVDPSTVYSCWPDIKRVNDTPWSGILDPFYQLLVSNSKTVHTSSVSGGRWISVRDAVFIADEVPVAVNDAMIKCNVNLVKINDSCSEALKQYHSLKTLQPGLVRSHLKSNTYSYCNASRQEKLEILKYILKDDAFRDIIGLQLLPLANGTFQQFQNKSRYVDDIFVSSSSYPSSLLPGLESQLVSVYNEDSTLHSQLCSVVESNYTQLVLLNTEQVANLLSKCNTSHWSHDQMSHFWQWLDNKQLSYFQSKPIVPVKSHTGGTSATALAKQDGVVYISPFNHVTSAALLSGLEKCGIRFADARDFSYLKHNQLSQYLYQFENDQVLDAMHSLYLNSVSFSSTEAVALQNFFLNSQLDYKKISTLCKIPLFKALQYNEFSRVSINTIRTSYCNNKAIAMSGTYSFRTDLLTNSPLIIDVTGNVSSLVRHLSGHVYLMQETEYLQKVAFQQIRTRQFINSSIVPFMISVLDNFYSPQYRQSANQLTSAMSSLPFVEVSNSSTLDTPQNLFDPEIEILLQLYNGENKFPSSSFHSYLPILRQCGLKSSVNADEIFQILSSLRSRAHYSTSYNVGQVKFSRILSVLKYLSDNPHLFNSYIKGYRNKLLAILCNQASQYCWLPVASNPPSNYPSSLTWKGSQYSTCLVSSGVSPLVVLSQDLSTSELPLIVGSQAIFVENTPHQLSQNLISHPMSLVPAVISHFNQVILHKDKISGDMLQSISFKTYTYLQQNISYCNAQLILDKWIWLESRSTFIDSSQVAVAGNPSFRSSLEPFIFVLPSNLQKFSNLFIRCGVPDSVTASQILSVLKSIQDQSGGSQITNDNAWSIVRAILDWIADDTERMREGNALIPVESDSSYPQLLPIEDVSYTDNEMLRDIANASDEEYNLMHPKVTYLVPILGITPLSDHLDITEDVFDDAGQHEPLTTRLGNILREYKDGLTIIKEMIQNADDAGATEVNILFDNRSHSTQKLLFKGMAESHGPALIVHNNSTFTKEDFENITKLAGATKANQPLKIGKFGVGFCSVYHITDVPSFVSGEWLYIFDPTLKYLKGAVRNESRPGKKVKYQSKFLAQSQQMAPYEGLFGFTSSANYNGTIFRLPFRTSSSQISSTIYNERLVQKMKNDLIENGSKLLLFLQNVKRITFRSMQGDEVCISSMNEGNGIKHCTTNSPANNSVSEYWLVSCQEEKLQAQAGDYQPGTASIACQLVKEDSSFECKPVEGSVFCFLPLSLPCTGLPVHVNANFAVMSNRSGIWTGASSGEPSDSREYWNKKLMTTIIPNAYCNLLKMVKKMCVARSLVSYEFFALWPLSKELQMKYPWEEMIPVLLKLISHESLFYSSSTHQWLTLNKSKFLTSLFGSSEYTSFDKAASILQLPVVSLPKSYLDELKDTASIISESEFATEFLNKIHLFDDCFQTRNKILLSMLSAIGSDPVQYAECSNEFKKVPSIPTSPNGVDLKLATELVDPKEFEDMFDSEDGIFPLHDFYENPLVREAMIKQLNLMTVTISWAAITSSARTIKLLFNSDKNKALKRVKRIIKSIDQTTYTSCPDDALKFVPFLPVLQMPKVYILPWKGVGSTVLPPSEVLTVMHRFSNDPWKAGIIAGSQKAIVNINYDGCGFIPHRVLQLLEISTRPTLDDVLNHFQLLIELMAGDNSKKFLQKEDTRSHIHAICQNVYEFFENLPKTEIEEKLSYYRDKPFIWNGEEFVTPGSVAKNWKKEGGPILYKLPDIMSMRKNLQEVLNIQENFDLHKLLDTLAELYQEYNQNPLPPDFHEFIDLLMSELVLAKGTCEGREQIILVDKNYVLCPNSDLYYNDAKWLKTEEDKYHFIHKSMTSHKAESLGVKFYRSSFLDKFADNSAFGTEFGQREELTQRIKNILRDYPLNESFIKELLQNSDDAKANRICVILDKRQHGKETTLSKEWGDDLQGPALLVWNDTDFTDKDLVGIQKLGLGSKRENDESIGQFGVGFNVVYHVTDCPSFITRDNSILCVFDPHCRYVYLHGANKINPGRQYGDLNNGFWETMKDLRSTYLQDPIPNQPEYLKTGTLFRYPLRSTIELVQKSEILENKKVHSVEVHSAKVMEEKLNAWVINIEEALLFLNHIAQFEYYVIESSECKFKLKTRYRVTMSETALDSRCNYQSHLSQQSILRKSQRTCVPKVFTYTLTLHSEDNRFTSNSKMKKQEWVIQQGVGDLLKPDQQWQFMDHVLPKNGLAVPLKPVPHFSGQIFCFLPLPVNSELPVHINGQFVLSSNRRALWGGDDEYSDKVNWNNQLVEAIASSYIHFLTELRHIVINDTGYSDRKEFYAAVNRYYEIFPYWMSSKVINDETSSTLSPNVRVGMSPMMRLSGNTVTTSQSVPVKKEKIFDPQWLSLAKSVFSKLWTMNVEILVVEAYDESIIKPDWHMLHNDTEPFSQVYFQPPQSKNILPILRRIGMTLTCASKVLHKHCKEFGSFIAEPNQTFEFYKKFHSQIVSSDSEPVTSTPFKTVQNFVDFLRYIMKKSENSYNFEFFELPYDLPLLLTADSCIRFFKENNKVLCSEYSDHFPNSASAFLHPDMLKLNMSPSYFLQKEEATFAHVNKIFHENLPSELSHSEVDDHIIDRAMLKDLWMCLSDPNENFHQHQKEFVSHWALLPSKSHLLYRSDSSILPICESIEEVENELSLKRILFDFLYIPLLDDTVHHNASKYCPVLSEYDKVFRVIYNKQNQCHVLERAELSEEDTDILLCYFSRTTFRHTPAIKNQIKSFPIFKTVNGVFASLLGKSVYLWPIGGFCIAGYEKWALLESVVFLEYNGSWRKLCGTEFALLGEVPDEREIYCKLIFPRFAKLTEAERKQHLEYIRDKLLDNAIFQTKYNSAMYALAVKFVSALKALKCLSHNDILLNIASFCDHTMPIFSTFPEHFYFLSDDYCSDDWLEFFRKLDLQVKIDFETFVRLSEQVARGDHPELKKASIVLFSYIFSKSAAESWHGNKYKMSVIGDIRFVITEKLKQFTWIKAPCSPPHEYQSQNIGLTKLNEAVLYKNAPLIWTVKPVIVLPILPSLMTEIEVLAILKELGVTLVPDSKDVYQNIINISRTNLANPKLFSTYDPALECRDDMNRADIFNTILEIIQYLHKNKKIELLQQLIDVPCIPVHADETDSSKPILVRPRQVLGSTAALDFFPYLHYVPMKLFGIMEALNIMGVSNKLELRHINYMLRLMNEFHSRGAIANPNEIRHIRKAIFKLHDLLEDRNITKSDKLSQLESLCLPSQIHRSYFKLVASKQLVFKDTTRFSQSGLGPDHFSNSSYCLFKIPSRDIGSNIKIPLCDIGSNIKIPSCDIGSNIKIPSCDIGSNIKIIREIDFCLQLPKDIRPIGLSLCVHETVVEHSITKESPLVQHFAKFRKLFPQIVEHIPKMIRLSFPYANEDEKAKFVAKLQEILTEMNVVAIVDLCVRVRLGEDTESIGEFKVNYSLQKSDQIYTLYVDKETTSGPSLWPEMAQTICIEISRALDCDLVKFFSCRYILSQILAVQTISDMQALVTEQDFLAVNNDDVGDDYIPKIGCPIPEALVRILSQDINNILRPQDLVGYEKATKHFIWAMILHPVNDDSNEPKLKRYMIAWSESEEPIKVSSVYLYKFVSEENIEVSSETALVASEGGSSELQQMKDSKELLAIKRKIAKELKLIWNSDLTKDERKKAVHRMFLIYHPDKVTSKKDLYEEAFKYLLRQLERLDEGLPIEEPEEEKTEDDCNSSYWHDYYDKCKDDINRSSYGGGGGGGGWSGGGGGGGGWWTYIAPKPDEVEAERWLRQAKSDLEAMRILHNSLDGSCISCQVSFMAHEVVEKALKAGMYKLIGINPSSESLVHHRLTSHARAISSERPGQLEDLPRIASEMESTYLDTRFPNKHPKPKAPVDVYLPDQARINAAMAEEIYGHLEKIVKNQL